VHAVQSRAAIHQILNEANGNKQYVMKPARRNRSSGVNLRTVLPRRTLSQTYQDVSRIKVSKEEPWILRQYITGEEYHTCSIVADGDVKAFVACPAPQLPPDYHSLPTNTGIGKAMLNFTQAFVAKAGSNYTGHLSFKFRVEETATESGIRLNILPVACNPQVNTTMVLFAGTKGSVDLVQAYMKALAPSTDGINGYGGLTHSEYSSDDVSFPHSTMTGVYFSGQDLVSFVLIPLFQLLTFKMGIVQFLHECATFLNHLLFWRDAIYELGDPLPWFWLYHVYLPLHFLSQIWRGEKWN
jgi:hypothetical protein